jgi:hypothetical protein
MATSTDSSYGSQLVEMQGSFKLAYPMLPELGCLLTEVAANGCRGQILFKFVPDAVARSWKRCLGPNRPVRIRIEGHPVIGTMQLDCIVNRVHDTPDATNIELWFNQLTPGQASLLQQASELSGAKAIQPVGAPQMPILVSSGEIPAVTGPDHAGSHGGNGQSGASAPVMQKRPVTSSRPPPPPPPPPPRIPPRPPTSRGPSPVLLQAAAANAAQPPAAPVAPAHVVQPWPSQPAAPAQSAPIPPAPVVPQAAAPPIPSAPATSKPTESEPQSASELESVDGAPSNEAALSNDAAPVQSQTETASIEVSPTQSIPANPMVERLHMHGQPMSSLSRAKLGDVLVKMGKLTQEQVEEAAAEARARHEKLGRSLVRTETITPDVLCRALAMQSGLPMTDLTDFEISQNLARLFPHSLMLRHCFLPFDENASFVCVAASNPINSGALAELERVAHRKIEVFLAREDYVLQHISTLRGRQADVPRRHIRYDIAIPVLYQFCTRLGSPVESSQHEGSTINISEGGMLVRGSPARVGTVQDVLRKGLCLNTVLCYGTPQEIRCICRVKSIREGGADWHIGMQLVDTTEEDRRKLRELCLKNVLKK